MRALALPSRGSALLAELLLQWAQSDRSASCLQSGGILNREWAETPGAVPVDLRPIQLGTTLEDPNTIVQERWVQRRSIPAVDRGPEEPERTSLEGRAGDRMEHDEPGRLRASSPDLAITR